MMKIVLTILATAASVSSAAMARELSHDPFAGKPAVIYSRPDTAPAYEMFWSSNPDVFNTDTSNPTYVQHDHGRP